MERIRIGIPRVRAFRGDDTLELLSDYGTGTIDTDVPVSDRPIRAWHGVPPFAGHLREGHVGSMHLDAVVPDGHFDSLHLHVDHLWPAALILLQSRPLYFGAIRFAVRVRDGAGNAGSTSASIERMANSSPRIGGDLLAQSFDVKSRAMTFTFRSSPDL